MIQRFILWVTAVAAIAAAAAVVVVAVAFAVYALVRPSLGPAGGAALVAFLAAVGIAAFAFFIWLRMRPRHAKTPPEGDMLARLANLARERPILAAGGLVAASIIAMRNPALTAVVVKSFLDSKKPPKS